MVRQKFLAKVNDWSTKSLTNSSKTTLLLMKFDCTDLVIGVSKAKKYKDRAVDIRFSVAPQKFNKNSEKPDVFLAILAFVGFLAFC